jgi:hypothetical protein
MSGESHLGLFMAYFGPLSVLLPGQVQDIAGQAHKVVALRATAAVPIAATSRVAKTIEN